MTKDEEIALYRKSPGNFYPVDFFKGRHRWCSFQSLIGQKIVELFNISSCVDFGCANGYYLLGMHKSGVKKLLGFEYMYDNVKKFIPAELSKYIKYGDVMEKIECGKFDCAMSIEVAEHILPEKSDIFIENLVNASNKYIMLTAATPNQGGTGHINEQPKTYWMQKIEQYGFMLSYDSIKNLKDALHFSRGYKKMVVKNMMIFKKI